MTEQHKLEIGLQLIEELANLIEGNEYEQFFSQHLIPVKVEMERQLTNLQHHSKIKE
jgi:hypothetical protein